MENSNSFRANAITDIVLKLAKTHMTELIACMVLNQHSRGIMKDRFMIDKTSADYYAAVDDAVNAVMTVLDITFEEAKDLVKDPKGHFELMYKLNGLFEEKEKEEIKEEE